MHGQIGDELVRLVAGADQLIIAAPYVKANALKKVLSQVSQDVSLVCITRWNLQDILLGASDIECRPIVRRLGGSFRLHPSLHAKYYRIDDLVLVGSANVTSSALGWQSNPNLEILCPAGNDFDAGAFQQGLLEDAREINDEEFWRWEEIVKASRQSDSLVPKMQPFLDNWKPATREPKHMELVYLGREEDIASFDERRAAHQDIQALLIPAGLTSVQFKAWASIYLLKAPFATNVIRLLATDSTEASRQLAYSFDLEIHEARRRMETVQNWLAYFAPDILDRDSLQR